MKKEKKQISYKKGAEVLTTIISKIVEFCPVRGTFNFVASDGSTIETKTDNIVKIEAI